MFERFTDGARRSTVLAQEEARMLGHPYIGTEHFLLGLIRQSDGIAAKVLRAAGVSLAGVRAKVEEFIGAGQTPTSGHIPFTPRAKSVFEFALREALQLHHRYIGTEHLLLGVIREGGGVACQVLVDLGVNLDDLRRQVIDHVEHGHVEGEVASAPLCPNCRTSMVGNLRSTFVLVEDNAPNIHLLVIYCSRCGVAIDTIVQRQSS